jgi:hypothetical protein
LRAKLRLYFVRSSSLQHGARVLSEILQNVCNRLLVLDIAAFAEFGAINGAAIVLAPTFGKSNQRDPRGVERVLRKRIGPYEPQIQRKTRLLCNGVLWPILPPLPSARAWQRSA